jgi:hypothetical protein
MPGSFPEPPAAVTHRLNPTEAANLPRRWEVSTGHVALEKYIPPQLPGQWKVE